jgi:hypothetical protein
LFGLFLFSICCTIAGESLSDAEDVVMLLSKKSKAILVTGHEGT